MRVLIGYMIDGRNSGIDKYLLRVLDILHAHGIHGDVLAAADSKSLRECLRPYGAEVLVIPSLMHPLKQYRCMGEIIRQGGYDAAYFNISEPMNCIGILAAHRQGIRTVIHSHNTAQGETGGVKCMIKTLLNRLARNRLSHWGDSFYACSQAAGRWLYPKRIWDGGALRLLYNPIPVEEFAYDREKRRALRRALGLENALVIGHVGNFVPAKNSEFLPEILSETKKRMPTAVLLSIGDGAQRQQVMDKTREMGLERDARFLGLRDDVPALLQAMDVFILPSRYEGLPVSAIEAQMAGLPAFLSDRITKEAALNADCHFLPIDRGAALWGDAIVGALPCKRKDYRTQRNEIQRFDLRCQEDAILAIFQTDGGTEK